VKKLQNYFHLVLILLLGLSFNSCLSKKYFKKYVEEAVPQHIDIGKSYAQDLPEFAILQLDTSNECSTPFEITRTKNYIIPAVVLWTWNTTYVTKIHKNMYLDIFVDVFQQKSKELNLEKYFDNRKLIIQIENLPQEFSFTRNGYAAYLLYMYTYGFGEQIYAVNQTFRVRYKIIQGDFEMANEVFEVKFNDALTNSFTKTSMFLQEYMMQQTSNYRKSCEELCDRIIESL